MARQDVTDVTFMECVDVDHDAYTVMYGGETRGLAIVPAVHSGMPPRLLALCRARRTAAVYGVCPICTGEEEGGPAPAGFAVKSFRHEGACPVTDDALGATHDAWVRQVGYARGRRLVEDIEKP